MLFLLPALYASISCSTERGRFKCVFIPSKHARKFSAQSSRSAGVPSASIRPPDYHGLAPPAPQACRLLENASGCLLRRNTKPEFPHGHFEALPAQNTTLTGLVKELCKDFRRLCADLDLASWRRMGGRHDLRIRWCQLSISKQEFGFQS